MDALSLHSNILEGYKDYIQSFIDIHDDDIRAKVEESLRSRKLWPKSHAAAIPSSPISSAASTSSRHGAVASPLFSIKAPTSASLKSLVSSSPNSPEPSAKTTIHGPSHRPESQAPVEASVELTDTQKRILSALKSYALSSKELLIHLGYGQKTGNYKSAINFLFATNLIEYCIPDKPNSRLQKYRLTQKATILFSDIIHSSSQPTPNHD
jgi:hypothetical protein